MFGNINQRRTTYYVIDKIGWIEGHLGHTLRSILAGKNIVRSGLSVKRCKGIKCGVQ